MIRATSIRTALACALFLAALPSTLAGQAGAWTGVRDRLLDPDPDVRAEAVAQLLAVPIDSIGPDVREAAINALAHANAVRLEARRRGVPHSTVAHPSENLGLARLVSRLRDPRAVPALVDALGFGFSVIEGLAALGQSAFDAVAEKAEHGPVTGATDAAQVSDALVVLRFMLEGETLTPVSPAARRTLRRIVLHHLAAEHRFESVLWAAMGLAAVLDDSEANEVLRTLAQDRGAVRARGVEESDLVERTMALARDLLAGVPARPRPR